MFASITIHPPRPCLHFPAYLSTYLPASLPTCLPACLLSCLLTCLVFPLPPLFLFLVFLPCFLSISFYSPSYFISTFTPSYFPCYYFLLFISSFLFPSIAFCLITCPLVCLHVLTACFPLPPFFFFISSFVPSIPPLHVHSFPFQCCHEWL